MKHARAEEAPPLSAERMAGLAAIAATALLDATGDQVDEALKALETHYPARIFTRTARDVGPRFVWLVRDELEGRRTP